MTQDELNLAYKPAKKDKRVPTMWAYLRHRAWVPAITFEQVFGWKDRQCRHTAEQSEGQIISGNKGYCLTVKASIEDFNVCNGRIYSQGKKMINRALEQQRVYHGQGKARKGQTA